MSNNVYEPPKANLLVHENQSNQFFVVSRRKFWILYISTFSLYQLYWFYQHWLHEKVKTQASFWPLARAIFMEFFTHALFKRFAQADNQPAEGLKQQSNRLSVYATLFVILSVFGYFLESIFPWLSSSMAMVVYIFMVPIEALLLFKGQAVANSISGDALGAQNHRLTAMNYVFIVLGLLIWLIVLTDAFGDGIFRYLVERLIG